MNKTSLLFFAAAVMASRVEGQTAIELAQSRSDAPMIFSFGGANQVSQSFLGVAVAELDSTRNRDQNARDVHGVEVTRVDDDSAAAKGGVKVGDVVLEYNGQRVEGTEQFIRLVRETPVGRQVTLTVSRSGATLPISLTMGSRRLGSPMISQGQSPVWFSMPEMPGMELPKVFGVRSAGVIGIEAEELTPQLAEFFGAKKGVLVRSVAPGSPAEKGGIRAGDVLVKLDQTEVTNPAEVRSAIQAARLRRNVVIELLRDKHLQTHTIELQSDQNFRQQTLPQGRSVKM